MHEPGGEEPVTEPSGATARATEPAATTAGLRLAVMLASFATILTVVVVVVVRRNDGTFTYAIDDPLIHLTIARNLGRHATFGIVPGVYESASSAPLWNVLLAPVLTVAPDAWWLPLVLNVAAAAWLLRTAASLPAIERLGSRALTIAVCVATPVLLGLVPLVMTGMEHTLHAALVAAFLVVLARIGSPAERRRDVVWAAALLAVGTLLRFETGFVAVAAAAIVLLDGRASDAASPRPGGRRHSTVALVLVAAAAVPALAFAAINVSFGQFPLPSSVVAKSDVGEGLPIPDPAAILERLTADPLLLTLLVIATGVLVVARTGRRASADTRAATRALAVVLLTAALHVCFADVGWFDRYQAYLIVALVVALAIAAPAFAGWRGWRQRAAVAALVLCILRIPLLVNTPLATFNVFQNQYQLGRFLSTAYQGDAVAINDLGYVSWYHEGPIVDVAGLGSIEVLRAAKEGRLDAGRFAELADEHDVRLVAVYDRFFAGLIPPGWEEAGRWCATNRLFVLSSDCVAFYAPAGADAEAARGALERYAPQLPPETVSTITGS